jgi:hypothetical protein
MEETAMQTKTGEATTAQDYNRNKYYIENSTELTEAEKIRMAKDLLNLESQGVIEWCDGAWRLVPGVEIEESPDGPVARFREAGGAAPTSLSTSCWEEPSERRRVHPLNNDAPSLSDGASSPDSTHQEGVNKERRGMQ